MSSRPVCVSYADGVFSVIRRKGFLAYHRLFNSNQFILKENENSGDTMCLPIYCDPDSSFPISCELFFCQLIVQTAIEKAKYNK